MKIAIIGWGSLIGDPRNLQIKGQWNKDGPFLPIEFARISEDKRLTLVLYPDAAVSHGFMRIPVLAGFSAGARMSIAS